ncbi:MAG: 16S rRNA (adenine(1518)-N(6)/adenine(1519)-N(6))-dimethyltransferase RsmA [Sandaracinaceae bacterium]
MSAPDWEDPRRVMKRHGLAPKRRFSQNFLVARHVVEAIVSALELAPGDPVVELGPGLGTLSAAIVRAGARLVAIDADPDMLRVLGEELGAVDTVSIRHGDAATVDLDALAAELGGRVALAGNLPYAITGAILKNLTQHRSAVRRAVVMVQREVQERMVAPPGSRTYGTLSVFLQASFDLRTVVRVPPGAFHPPPKVWSTVVSLTPREVPRAVERPAFVAVVRAAFGQRRKTLRNALRTLGEPGEAALLESGIDPGLRAEVLSIEELDRIADRYEARGGAAA